jgi:hypothetical protein
LKRRTSAARTLICNRLFFIRFSKHHISYQLAGAFAAKLSGSLLPGN